MRPCAVGELVGRQESNFTATSTTGGQGGGCMGVSMKWMGVAMLEAEQQMGHVSICT